jgi:hypothetical protein
MFPPLFALWEGGKNNSSTVTQKQHTPYKLCAGIISFCRSPASNTGSTLTKRCFDEQKKEACSIVDIILSVPQNIDRLELIFYTKVTFDMMWTAH